MTATLVIALSRDDGFRTRKEIAASLAALGIGRFAASDSGITRNYPISHALTADDSRTLCGRSTLGWSTRDDAYEGGPDCLRCRKRWDALGADAAIAGAGGGL